MDPAPQVSPGHSHGSAALASDQAPYRYPRVHVKGPLPPGRLGRPLECLVTDRETCLRSLASWHCETPSQDRTARLFVSLAPYSMSTHFQQKKNNILTRLALDSPDASPKGYVDEEIRPLVDQLNKHNGIVTTSSCAGRIVVFLEGVKKKLVANSGPTFLERLPGGLRDNLDHSSANRDTSLEDDAPQRAGIGGKGPGGQWIFVSHAPVQNGLLTWQKLLDDSMKGYLSCDEGTDSIVHALPHTNPHVISEESRFLHLKFEPMVCFHRHG